MNDTIWILVTLFVAVALLVEFAVVLIWTRGMARLHLALGVGLLLVNQLLLPPLWGRFAGGGLLNQLVNLGALVLLGFGVIASRPVKET